MTNFRLFGISCEWQTVLQMGRKHCRKKEKLLNKAISPFPTVFSKDLYSLNIKMTDFRLFQIDGNFKFHVNGQKTLPENDKLLIMSNLSFSHSVF